jgi:catechol 2,3-dioxygenase-like lactoylglutathione lyase family enzyme
VPIDHVKLPISDLDASRSFYKAALAPFEYKLVYDESPGLGFGKGDGSDENEPFDLLLGERPNIRTHVAFTATSTEQVDEFYAAAIAAGGRDNGPPGRAAVRRLLLRRLRPRPRRPQRRGRLPRRPQRVTRRRGGGGGVESQRSKDGAARSRRC